MNRLKAVRKAKRLTQDEVARFIGITQNAYSYWENGKVKIDIESLKKLSDYFQVSLDFLSGKPYTLANPVSEWHPSYQEDYYSSTPEERTFLEYQCGNPVFHDDGSANSSTSADEAELASFLTELKTRPEMRMLFSLAKGATKKDVEQAVAIIEALRKNEDG